MNAEDKASVGRRQFLRALGAGAAAARGGAARRRGAWPTARATTRSARRATGNPTRSRPTTASTAIRAEGGARADQENRTSGAGAARSPPLAGQSDRGLDRRGFLRRSGLVAGGLAALGALPLGSVRKAAAGPPPRRRRAGGDPQEHLHPLLGRLHGHGRGRQRRVDRPGAELGQPDQPRLALRQGRLGARARLRRAAAQISDEAGQRPVDPHQLGPGHQRDRRQADGDPRAIGPGFGLLARLGEVHQRGRLSLPQARRVLGHQQHRSPGAHLPFDHGHRRRQYLGLRRDDQQLQRHPQRQDPDHHGRQSGRGASGVAAAPARGRGAQQGELHRHRSRG